MRYHVAKRSENAKTGGIAVTTTTADSCPPSCPLKGRGCYAENAPLAWHWKALERRGTGLDVHLTDIRAASMAAGKIRLNQAGDLPENLETALAICEAPAPGAIAWTYTHRTDRTYLAAVNETRTVVNVSANSPAEADEYAGFPTVCLLDEDRRFSRTPGGRMIVRCPAEYREVTCQSCGGGRPLCARRNRGFVVGFTAHGSRAALVRDVVAENS